MTKRLLLLLPTASYRNDDFLAAGRALGIDIVTAADYCHQLAPGWGLPPLLGLQFDHPQQAMETIVGALERPPTPCWRWTTAAWNWPPCCAKNGNCRAIRFPRLP